MWRRGRVVAWEGKLMAKTKKNKITKVEQTIADLKGLIAGLGGSKAADAGNGSEGDAGARRSSVVTDDSDDELVAIFRRLDVDESGSISTKELANGLHDHPELARRLNIRASGTDEQNKAEIDSWVRKADDNDDGEISKAEFEQFFLDNAVKSSVARGRWGSISEAAGVGSPKAADSGKVVSASQAVVMLGSSDGKAAEGGKGPAAGTEATFDDLQATAATEDKLKRNYSDVQRRNSLSADGDQAAATTASATGAASASAESPASAAKPKPASNKIQIIDGKTWVQKFDPTSKRNYYFVQGDNKTTTWTAPKGWGATPPQSQGPS